MTWRILITCGALLVLGLSWGTTVSAQTGIVWGDVVEVYRAPAGRGAWYPRLVRLNNGHILAAYDTNAYGPRTVIAVSESQDDAQTWNVIATKASFGDGDAANAQMITTDDGRILLAYRLANPPRYQLRLSASDDGGKTWEDLGIIHENYIGVWEPHMVLLPDQRIMVMYATEEHNAVYPQTIDAKVSDDGGLTWSKPWTIVRHFRSRDGMPVWYLDHEGQYHVYFEVSDEANPFVIKMATSKDGIQWSERKTVFAPQDPHSRAAAPYGIQLADGSQLVSFQTDADRIHKGDGEVDLWVVRSNDTEDWSQPDKVFSGPQPYAWNTLFEVTPGTVVAATSAPGRILIRFGHYEVGR